MAKIFFFYGDHKIEVEQETLTGLAVKEKIKAVDQSADLAHDLVMEGRGNDEDRRYGDDEPVPLAHGHGEGGPNTFFLRPPTDFGAT